MDGDEPMTLHLGAAVAHIASIRTELAQRTGCQEWEHAGIRAALIATEGAPADVSAAACLAAGDPGLRLPSEGGFRAHWPKNATAQPRVSMDVPCPEHALSEPCPACKAIREENALTPEEIAERARACREASAAKPYIPPAVKRAQTIEETP
jgi:hypothetical protein